MTKAELIQAMVDKTHLHKNSAAELLDAFVEVVKEELADGNDITLVGFGTFTVANKAAREGRNPKTGEPITIAACRMPKFKPGKGLKDAVNA